MLEMVSTGPDCLCSPYRLWDKGVLKKCLGKPNTLWEPLLQANCWQIQDSKSSLVKSNMVYAPQEYGREMCGTMQRSLMETASEMGRGSHL